MCIHTVLEWFYHILFVSTSSVTLIILLIVTKYDNFSLISNYKLFVLNSCGYNMLPILKCA